MAHEIRHLYVETPEHANSGLGSDEPDLTGVTSRASFSSDDKADILEAIKGWENKQTSATSVVNNFGPEERVKPFPF